PALEELPPLKALSPAEVEKLRVEGAVVLDVRDSSKYANGHIGESLHIALSGQFASWAGMLIRPASSVVFVGEDADQVHEARVRLSRVGLDRVLGYLDGGILAWDRAGLPLKKIELITVQDLQHRIADGLVDRVVDVRRGAEWDTGHIASAQNEPLQHLEESARRFH